MIRSCAVQPHPETQWDTELFDALKGLPWNPPGQDAERAAGAKEHTAELQRFTVVRSSESVIPQARRALITRDILSVLDLLLGVQSVRRASCSVQLVCFRRQQDKVSEAVRALI